MFSFVVCAAGNGNGANCRDLFSCMHVTLRVDGERSVNEHQSEYASAVFTVRVFPPSSDEWKALYEHPAEGVYK